MVSKSLTLQHIFPTVGRENDAVIDLRWRGKNFNPSSLFSLRAARHTTLHQPDGAYGFSSFISPIGSRGVEKMVEDMREDVLRAGWKGMLSRKEEIFG